MAAPLFLPGLYRGPRLLPVLTPRGGMLRRCSERVVGNCEVETMPALAFVADPNGNRTFMNRGFLEYTGLSPEEASASGWVKTIHPEDLNRITERWRESQTNGRPLD